MFALIWKIATLDVLADLYVAAGPGERERMAAGVEALNARRRSSPHDEGSRARTGSGSRSRPCSPSTSTFPRPTAWCASSGSSGTAADARYPFRHVSSAPFPWVGCAGSSARTSSVAPAAARRTSTHPPTSVLANG